MQKSRFLLFWEYFMSVKSDFLNNLLLSVAKSFHVWKRCKCPCPCPCPVQADSSCVKPKQELHLTSGNEEDLQLGWTDGGRLKTAYANWPPARQPAGVFSLYCSYIYIIMQCCLLPGSKMFHSKKKFSSCPCLCSCSTPVLVQIHVRVPVPVHAHVPVRVHAHVRVHVHVWSTSMFMTMPTLRPRLCLSPYLRPCPCSCPHPCQSPRARHQHGSMFRL